MKIIDNIRYPHPVLSKQTDDFIEGQFVAEFDYQEDSEETLIISSSLKLDSALLNLLHEQRQVSSGYYVVCQDTYFNRLQIAPLGDSEASFDRKSLFGTIIIRPILWTAEAITDIEDRTINSEFGGVVDFPKGTILALGSEFRMSIDPARFKPFESIFEFSVDEKSQDGAISVDTEGDKVKIIVSSGTMATIRNLRQLDHGKKILLNSVYLPAVMDVIAQLRDENTSSEGTMWYRVFKAKCDELGIDVNASSTTIIELAQKILRQPLRGTLEVMESFA